MAQQTTLPVSGYFKLEQLAEGVYAAICQEGAGAWSNAGFVDLGDATLIFDTFLTPGAATDLRKAAEQLTGHPVRYVVNSHWHFDHVMGNQVFEDAQILSTAKTLEVMRTYFQFDDIPKIQEMHTQHLQELAEVKDKETNPRIVRSLEIEIAEKTQLRDALPELRVTWPNVTFQDKLVIHGSRRTVELYCFGGGHSPSDTFLYLPEEKLAFMGDLVFVQTQPSVHSESPQEWIRILEQVQTFEIQQLVPGHGAVGGREDIVKTQTYLQDLSVVFHKAMEQGATMEQLEGMQAPDAYGEWDFAHVFPWNLSALYQQQQG